MRHGRRGDDAGAAAVEFALLLPLFVVLVFGIISGGVVFNDKLSLSQGVREAARYAATLNIAGTQRGPETQAEATTFLGQVLTTAQGDAYGQMGTGSATYCAQYVPASATYSTYFMSDPAGTAQLGTCAGAPSVNAGTVVVIGSKPATFNLIFYSYSTTLTSVGVARYEGQA